MKELLVLLLALGALYMQAAEIPDLDERDADARKRREEFQIIFDRVEQKKKLDIALGKAAAAGKAHEAQMLINAGADIGYRVEWSKYQALHEAAAHGHADVCDLLLDAGADSDSVDYSGATPLHLAAHEEYDTTCRLLLRRGANIESKNRNGCTPLHTAAQFGNPAVCKLLLRSGAAIDSRSDDKSIPLSLAAENCHFDVCRLLVEHGTDINGRFDNQHPSFFSWAAYSHYDTAKKKFKERLISFLLEKGARVNQRDDVGRTPPFYAIWHCNLPLYTKLVAAGADIQYVKDHINVKSTDGSRTALHEAVRCNDLVMVAKILELGADVNVCNKDGETPLWHAAVYSHIPMARLLLASGAQIDAPNAQGEHLLRKIIERQHSSESDKMAMVELLIEYGADVHVRNAKGETLLWSADVDMCKRLLALGVDINARNVDGHDVLMHALHNNFGHAKLFIAEGCSTQLAREHINEFKFKNSDEPILIHLSSFCPAPHCYWASTWLDYCTMFLDLGVDVNLCDVQGKTALAESLFNFNMDLYAILIKAGADIEKVKAFMRKNQFYFANAIRLIISNPQTFTDTQVQDICNLYISLDADPIFADQQGKFLIDTILNVKLYKGTYEHQWRRNRILCTLVDNGAYIPPVYTNVLKGFLPRPLFVSMMLYKYTPEKIRRLTQAQKNLLLGYAAMQVQEIFVKALLAVGASPLAGQDISTYQRLIRAIRRLDAHPSSQAAMLAASYRNMLTLFNHHISQKYAHRIANITQLQGEKTVPIDTIFPEEMVYEILTQTSDDAFALMLAGIKKEQGSS